MHRIVRLVSTQGEGPHPSRYQRGRLQRVRPSAGRHHPEERAGHQEPRRHSLGERVHRSGDAGLVVATGAKLKDRK